MKLSKIFSTGGGDNVRYFVERPNVLKFLDKNLGFVLECGSGMGTMHTPYLYKNSSKLVMLEINEEMIGNLKKKYPKAFLVRADMEAVPFKDGIFDTVVGVQVLEHLEKDRKGIEESMRVSKLGGKHVFSFPLYVSDDTIHFHGGKYGDKRNYTVENVKELLNGVEIKKIKFSGMVFSKFVDKMLSKKRLPNFIIAISLLDFFIPKTEKLRPRFMTVETVKSN